VATWRQQRTTLEQLIAVQVAAGASLLLLALMIRRRRDLDVGRAALAGAVVLALIRH